MITFEQIKGEIIRLFEAESIVPKEVKIFQHPERSNELVLQVETNKSVALVTMLDEYRDERTLEEYSRQFIEPAAWNLAQELRNLDCSNAQGAQL